MAATADRIPYPRLLDFVAVALQRVGLPPEDAATVAALMAEADLQGSDGAGLIGAHQQRRAHVTGAQGGSGAGASLLGAGASRAIELSIEADSHDRAAGGGKRG